MFSCLSSATRLAKTFSSASSLSSALLLQSRLHHNLRLSTPSLVRPSQPHTQSPSRPALLLTHPCRLPSFILPPTCSSPSSSLILSSPSSKLSHHITRQLTTTSSVMDLTGESRVKRKGSPVPLDRPPKLRK